MGKHQILGGGAAACAVLVGGLFALAQEKQDKPVPTEQERQVTEAEVPKAALEALKKLAAGATFKEFAEEIEHGHVFYEGSWQGPMGNVDALVTPSGDLVEIEEIIPPDKVPGAVRSEAEKAAGKDAAVTFEKKTMLLYELHFRKDGKFHEILLTPDARPVHEEAEAPDKDEDEDH
jgi:hypothetical protein